MPLIKQKHEMPSKRQARKQQGFVLVLALVLLAVMTLIGVSSMNSANMELKATANAQQHQYVFTAGQSLLEFMVSATGLTTAGIPIDYQTTDAAPQPVNITLDGVVIAGEVTYVGCVAGVGSSLEEGRGFSYNFYNAEGNGVNAAGTATSIQNQGVRYPAAACDK